MSKPMTFHKLNDDNDWEFACITCGGKGYDEKLSCGCTGYRMRRQCVGCKGKGTVTVSRHVTQANEQRKPIEEMCRGKR